MISNFKKLLLLLFLSSMLASGANAQQWWGALYFSKETGISGASWDYKTRADAKEKAYSVCVDKHQGKKNNCKYLTSFFNGCAAIYQSPVTKNFGFGTNDLDSKRAERVALSECGRAGEYNAEKFIVFVRL